MAHEQFLSYARAFIEAVSKIPFAQAEVWLAEQGEYFIETPKGAIPEEVNCSIIPLQEFNDCGRREIELMCGCYAEGMQAIGYVYLVEDGTSEVSPDIRIEPAS